MRFLAALKRWLSVNCLDEKIVCYICGAEVLPQPLSAEE